MTRKERKMERRAKFKHPLIKFSSHLEAKAVKFLLEILPRPDTSLYGKIFNDGEIGCYTYGSGKIYCHECHYFRHGFYCQKREELNERREYAMYP